MAALGPFRVPAQSHVDGSLAYLAPAGDAFALELAVQLAHGCCEAQTLVRTNARELFWTPAQMVAHHTSGGCNLRPGDLLATGTISGPTREDAGCLLELTRNGAAPIRHASGEQRGFLQDGDEVIFTGWAQAGNALPVRLGECRGRIAAARSL